MPCLVRRSELLSELDTAPATRTGIFASASMKWFTVEPVPTPTMLPGWTYVIAAWPTRALSSSWVIARLCARHLADVARGRPNEPTDATLLEHVRAPPGDATDRERRRELFARQTDRVEQHGREE